MKRLAAGLILSVLSACAPIPEPGADVYITSIDPIDAVPGVLVILRGRFTTDLEFRACQAPLENPIFSDPERVIAPPGQGGFTLRYARVDAIVPPLPPGAECPVSIYRAGVPIGGGGDAVTLFIEPVAPDAPTITRFTPTTVAGTLELDFEPPEADGGRGVLNHEVQIDDGSYVPFSPPRIRGPVFLTGLPTGRDVTVRLRAVNEVGPGPASAPRTTRSVAAPDRPPDPDPDARAQVVDGELVLAVRGVTITIGIVDQEGDAIPIRARDPRLLVPAGGRVRVSGTGLLPGSSFLVWVYSRPQLLGFGTTLSDGTFGTALPIPPDLPEQEDHTVLVQAVGADEQPVDLGSDLLVADDQGARVIEVSIDQGDRSLLRGSTLALTGTVIAIGDVDRSVTWGTSEPGVVTVDDTGLLTAVAIGSATITLASVADATLTDAIGIVVAAPPGRPDALAGSIGDGSVALTWRPPADAGGLPILGYDVVGSPGGFCSTEGALACTIGGLTNRTPHTFTVTARHALAASDPSAPLTLTPLATPDPATSTLSVTPALLRNDGVATATVVVTLRDRDDELVGGSRGVVALRLSPPIGTLSAVTDLNDGTYAATVTAGTTVGEGLLTATLDGAPLATTVTLRVAEGVDVGFDVDAPILRDVRYDAATRRLTGIARDERSPIASLRVFDGPQLLASSLPSERGDAVAAVDYIVTSGRFAAIVPGGVGPDARRLDLIVADAAGNAARHTFLATP